MTTQDDPNIAEGSSHESRRSSESSSSSLGAYLRPPSNVEGVLEREYPPKGRSREPAFETVPHHQLMMDHRSLNSSNDHNGRQQESEPTSNQFNMRGTSSAEASSKYYQVQEGKRQYPFNDQRHDMEPHHSHPKKIRIHQELMTDYPFTSGQAAPTQQQLKLPPNPQETTSDYQEQQRRFEYDPQFQEERYKRSRKRKKRHGTHGKQAERWDEMFKRLCEFKRIHGHCLVPNRYVNDPSLGAWVSTQRRHYKILLSDDPSQTSPMTPERASKLISIGFQWATKDPRHVPWETRFQELVAYKQEYGDCVVPIGFKENPRLSNWVSAQRQEYKLFKQGKKCRINAERVEALNSVGFVWEAQRGSSQKQRKKAAMKDAMLGTAAAQILSLAAGENHDRPPAAPLDGSPNTSGQPRIPPSLDNLRRDLPPEVVSQVLSLLNAQEQSSNGSQIAAAQREVDAIAAARRLEDIVAPQRRNVVISPPQTSIRPPTSILSQSQASLINDLMKSNDAGISMQESHSASRVLANDKILDVPPHVEDAIITKHLREALCQDYRATAMGVDVAVGKIKRMLVRSMGHHSIDSAGETWRKEMPSVERRLPLIHNALRHPSVLTSSLQPPPTVAPRVESDTDSTDTDATETGSESSKYGAALQVSEITKDDTSFKGLGTSSSNVSSMPPAASKRVVTRESMTVEPSLSTGLEAKRPTSWGADGVGNERLLGIRRMSDHSSIDNGWHSSSVGGSDRGGVDDSGGVFSDAEEDDAMPTSILAV